MKKIVFTLLIFLVTYQLKADQCTCICNGNWGSASTWSAGHVPYCTDTVIICGAHIVTVSTQQDYSACPNPIYIFVSGELRFQTGNKITLPTGSVVTINVGGSLNPGNGGGVSNLITIGVTDVWSADEGTLNGYAVLTDGGPLPIELMAFKAKPENGIVRCEWTTATETNNDYFTIQRTIDGSNFENVTRIEGAGNSSMAKYYRADDQLPYKGRSYYRLKQTDYDGSVSFSGLIDVNMRPDDFTFQLLMNPNNGTMLRLEMNSPVNQELHMQINDARGKTVYSQAISIGENEEKIRDYYLPKQLEPGVYTISLISEAKKASKKLVVQ